MPSPPDSHGTLDPDDWNAFRVLAHRMVDDTLDHLAGLPDDPAWRPMPAKVRAAFKTSVPLDGEGEEAAYEAYLRLVRPYPNGNLHPRFYGWVQGNGTALGAMADFLGAALNPHMAGFDQAPALVEREVIRWLAGVMGFPTGTGGLLVTGGTMANVLGLAVARHARAGFDVRAEGLAAGPQLAVYGSEQTHGWARTAVELLGLGDHAFRRVRADLQDRVDVGAMRTAIRSDREAGIRPVCIMGTAGTVNTGASDDLAVLADLAAEEDLWFHVDGAFGAWAHASDRLRPLVAGLARADSLAFDLHKWGSMPFECACVLVRNDAALEAAFAAPAAYLAPSERGVIAGGLPFADRGVDLTRGFKALKVWMSLRAYGLRRFVAAVERNVDQAHRLAALVDTHPDLERMAEAPMNVVCFRVRPSGTALSESSLDTLNAETLLRLQERGLAVPSSTTLGGRFAIRACFVGHRTTEADVERLVADAVRVGLEVAGEVAD